MSLYIETEEVWRVLLADGWHAVDAQSFDIDAYEFIYQGDIVHGGGTGFSFSEDGDQIYGPMTSILAVNTRE